MPLDKSGGPGAFKTNIRTLMHDVGKSPHVQSRKQAIAIAYATARKYGKAAGGAAEEDEPATFKQRYPRGVWPGGNKEGVPMPEGTPELGRALQKKYNPKGRAPWENYAAGGIADESFVRKGSSIKLGREGMLNSSVPGRTDKLPMNVKTGSYILPADIPSALGQGNTMAGGQILKKMFNSGPYGLPLPRGGGRGGQRPMKKMFAEGGEVGEGEDEVPIVAAGGEYVIPPEVVQAIGHGNMKHGHSVLDKFVLKVRKHHISTLRGLPPPKK